MLHTNSHMHGMGADQEDQEDVTRDWKSESDDAQVNKFCFCHSSWMKKTRSQPQQIDPHLSGIRLLAFSADPVLRREVVRRQPPPTLLAAAAASLEAPEGLLMGENRQFWDSDAGAVVLC